MIVFRDTNGVVRFEGDVLAPGGSTADVLTQQADGTYAPDAAAGLAPVTCQLTANLADIATVAQHPILWDALFDNPWDGNAILAIPAGLGLTFVFDGTDADITTTTAGTWALSLDASCSTDATLQTILGDSLAQHAPLLASLAAPTASVAATYALPSAAVITPRFDTQIIATGATVAAFAQLVIVRLA